MKGDQETIRREEVAGRELVVYRRETDPIGEGRYAYEFELEIDGQEVMTASELEEHGVDGPQEGGDNWTANLLNFGRAYIETYDRVGGV